MVDVDRRRHRSVIRSCKIEAMKKLRRYLLIHLAKSLAIAIPIALIGLAAANIADYNELLSSLGLGVAAFATYWSVRFKTIQAALGKVKAPSEGDVVDELFDVDDVGS